VVVVVCDMVVMGLGWIWVKVWKSWVTAGPESTGS
jgi:hypothetical protein